MKELFQAIRPGVCAGFITAGGIVIDAAPILRKHILHQDIDVALARLKNLGYTVKKVGK